MTNSPTCGAKLRGKDERCKMRPAEGQKRCFRHGASTPQALAKVAKDKAKDALEKEMVMLGIRDTYETADPGAAMLHVLGATVAEERYLAGLVAKLANDEGVLTWRRTQHVTGANSKGMIDEETFAAVPDALITQLRDTRDRLARYATMALKAGIEERRVQIAENQAVAFAGVIQRILSRLHLTETQAADVSVVVPEELRALEGDPTR